ncbi:MAG: hypothetical protein C0603_11390 [Denitrovibrio sp.]|nr:MAG: hypothetical protein C0603_11390 [Denitrovibrio sp.]
MNIDRHDDNEPYWEDYLKYCFVSASGGPWYTKTLNALEPGNRIFAMLPKAGYLGVGIVTEKSVPYKDFYIKSSDGVAIHISESDIRKSICNSDPENLEQCGYYVKVDWTKHITTPYWEKGLRANQNSAFVLRHKFTLDKLIDHFEIVE